MPGIESVDSCDLLGARQKLQSCERWLGSGRSCLVSRDAMLALHAETRSSLGEVVRVLCSRWVSCALLCFCGGLPITHGSQQIPPIT